MKTQETHCVGSVFEEKQGFLAEDESREMRNASANMRERLCIHSGF